MERGRQADFSLIVDVLLFFFLPLSSLSHTHPYLYLSLFLSFHIHTHTLSLPLSISLIHKPQYVKFYGGELVAREPQGRCWRAYVRAVQLLQGIDDRSDPASPRRTSFATFNGKE